MVSYPVKDRDFFMEYVELTDHLRLPVAAEADVVVAGGGPAGLGAALFSARAGAKTLLLESYGIPGGMAAIGEVTPFMCSYYKGKVLDAPVYGEWKHAMESYLPPDVCERRRKDPDGLAGRGIGKEAAALAAEDLLLAAGVRILYHHPVTGVVMEGKHIDCVRCHCRGEEVVVRGKCFVDCTGDGDLAVLAHCRYAVGNDRGECQPMTLCFKLSHVETGWSQHSDDSKIFALRSRLNAAYASAVERGEIHCPRENVLLFSFELGDDRVVHFNTTRVVKLDPSDGLDLSAAEIEGRRQLREILFWLRREIPEFRNCRLMSMGVQIGVRESRHITGLQRITAADFRRCAKFDDAVARCSYAMDIHSPTGAGTRLEAIKEGDFYEIPYGCLAAADCDNLTLGGRLISADSEIHSSFRIMPTAISIGQAAGLAAATAALNNISPQKIDGRRLRKDLIAMGAFLE